MSGDEREATIAILSGVVERAQQRFHMLGMQNASGLSPADRARLDLEYEKARDEMNKAQDILREAIRSEPS